MNKLSMSQWLLSHTSCSKENSLTFVASKPSNKMKTTSHMKTVTTAVRAGKTSRSICTRHMLPPDQWHTTSSTILLFVYNWSITLWTRILHWLRFFRSNSILWFFHSTTNYHYQPNEQTKSSKRTYNFGNTKPIHHQPTETIFTILSLLSDVSMSIALSIALYDRISLCAEKSNSGFQPIGLLLQKQYYCCLLLYQQQFLFLIFNILVIYGLQIIKQSQKNVRKYQSIGLYLQLGQI